LADIQEMASPPLFFLILFFFIFFVRFERLPSSSDKEKEQEKEKGIKKAGGSTEADQPAFR
tara:strand:+ start:1168 stop:1350 length:183 start_codon:yes stop_codon:yes gene_type:complete